MSNQRSRHSRDRSPTSASFSRNTPARSTESSALRYFTAVAESSEPYESPYTQNIDRLSQSLSEATIYASNTHGSPRSSRSASSGDSLYIPSPGSHRQRRQRTPSEMSGSQNMSSSDKEQLIRSLRTHRVNTLTELRRIEKLFASNRASDVTEAMTSAWAHYVNSNNLLSELRGMTKNYPFSSECLDEAKWQVIGDPASTRSWNYCWLILKKIKDESLIRKHARTLAAKPSMWGGRTATAANVEKLASACHAEWTRALEQMLRQWATPPIRDDVRFEDGKWIVVSTAGSQDEPIQSVEEPVTTA